MDRLQRKDLGLSLGMRTGLELKGISVKAPTIWEEFDNFITIMMLFLSRISSIEHYWVSWGKRYVLTADVNFRFMVVNSEAREDSISDG